MFSAFVLAEGLRRSGMTERMGLFIIKIFGAGERRLIFGVMTASAVLSLFMNNIAAASLLLPSLSGVARRMKISPSKLLMPLAFGTIDDLKRFIKRQGQQRMRERIEEERAENSGNGAIKLSKSVVVPAKLTNAAELDALIQQLHEIKAQLGLYAEIEVSFVVSGQLGMDRG